MYFVVVCCSSVLSLYVCCLLLVVDLFICYFVGRCLLFGRLLCFLCVVVCGCWLIEVCCCYLSFVVVRSCMLLLVGGRCSLFVVRCSLFVVCSVTTVLRVFFFLALCIIVCLLLFVVC